MTVQSAGPDAEPDAGQQPRTRLRKGAVGVTGMVFFVLSAQAPLTGVAGTLPIPLGLGNGGAAPAVYLVVGVMVGLFAVGFIAMKPARDRQPAPSTRT